MDLGSIGHTVESQREDTVGPTIVYILERLSFLRDFRPWQWILIAYERLSLLEGRSTVLKFCMHACTCCYPSHLAWSWRHCSCRCPCRRWQGCPLTPLVRAGFPSSWRAPLVRCQSQSQMAPAWVGVENVSWYRYHILEVVLSCYANISYAQCGSLPWNACKVCNAEQRMKSPNSMKYDWSKFYTNFSFCQV